MNTWFVGGLQVVLEFVVNNVTCSDQFVHKLLRLSGNNAFRYLAY